MEANKSLTHGRVPIVELMLVVLALCVAAAPIAVVVLFLRLRNLQAQLLKLTNLSLEVTDGLRRDLLELKRQVESTTKSGAAEAAAPLTPTPQHATSQQNLSVTPAPVVVPRAN